MINRQTCNKFFPFRLTELKNVELFLQKMALKGWILKSINTGFSLFHFVKSEPQELYYSIDIFKKSTFMGSEINSDEVLEYIEYYKTDGWNHVCSYQGLMFFYNENDNPAPTYLSDEKLEQLKHLISQQNKQFGILYILLMSMTIYGYVKYGLSLNFVILTACESLIFPLMMSEDFLWYMKQKKNYLTNQSIEYTSNDTFQMKQTLMKLIIPMLYVNSSLLSVTTNENFFHSSTFWFKFSLCLFLLFITQFKHLKKFNDFFYFFAYSSIFSLIFSVVIEFFIKLLF